MRGRPAGAAAARVRREQLPGDVPDDGPRRGHVYDAPAPPTDTGRGQTGAQLAGLYSLKELSLISVAWRP